MHACLLVTIIWRNDRIFLACITKNFSLCLNLQKCIIWIPRLTYPNGEAFRRKDHGSCHCLAGEHHHRFCGSNHAILEEFYHRSEFGLIHNRCIRPIWTDYSLNNYFDTLSVKIFVIFVSVLIHANVFSFFAVTSNRVIIHYGPVTALIGEK